MAWNSRSKDLARVVVPEVKRIPVGAPAAMNPQVAAGTAGYQDGWDIERAYKDGVSKVVWVWRAIDAIASNQAKLPMVLRKDNAPDGEIITDDPILQLLNAQSNMGENAFIFRYRISSQLQMSTRGVFIEVLRDPSGKVIALHLLPPQHTAPLPDPRRFVKGYEVAVPNTKRIVLKPEDVIWIRRPHPLDPYLSMTPMESAGVAIEIEMLAKLYNRNFLLNDGRPGGLLVLRDDVSDEDRQELVSRFRGNVARTGAVGVISAANGADFVDTASSPRDAAYAQMRQITKEEILAAFGVPESIIGNSAARTFANASEEGKVFWMETMRPHLELISRPLSILTPDNVVEFDTGEVPILVLAKQEQAGFALSEFKTGLISTNEYRKIIGRKLIVSELADSLLANPNLTPLGNTEKPTPDPNAAQDPNAAGGPVSPGSLASQSADANAARTNPITAFDAATGTFQDLNSTQTTDIELPAAQVPSEVNVGDTGGPVVQ